MTAEANAIQTIGTILETEDKLKETKFVQGLNNFEEKLSTGAGPLDWLRSVNNFLEGMPRTVVSYFNTIFKSGEKFSQKAVDMICEYGAWFVNYNVEKMRQRVIKSLYEQYGIMSAIQKKIMVVKSLIENPLGILGAVVSAVKSILNLFFGPFIFVITYMVNVVKEVIRLGENLANIAAVLPPEPPNPQLNFNAFKLQLGKMGASILTDDPSQLPPPIEMFPEPIRPFTPAYFKALGSGVANTYRDQKTFYNLPDEDFATKMSQKYNSSKLALNSKKTISGDDSNSNNIA